MDGAERKIHVLTDRLPADQLRHVARRAHQAMGDACRPLRDFLHHGVRRRDVNAARDAIGDVVGIVLQQHVDGQCPKAERLPIWDAQALALVGTQAAVLQHEDGRGRHIGRAAQLLVHIAARFHRHMPLGAVAPQEHAHPQALLRIGGLRLQPLCKLRLQPVRR